MQICRQKFLCAIAVGFTVLINCQFHAFAQSGSGYDSFSSIGSISSPEMPTVTSPTMGSGFYMPGNNSNPIYTGNQNSTANEISKKEEAEEKKTSLTTSLLSTLTASDISSLDSLGILNQVTSLYSSDSSSLSNISSISNLYTSSSNNVTNILLQKVLTELESIKSNNDTASATTSTQKTPQSESSNSPSQMNSQNSLSSTVNFKSELQNSGTKRNNPKILRFSVNGYDILATCRTIYISQIQGNGSFLVTGDRRYISDGKSRTETFHILFKPNEASNGISSYSTATGVTQDYMNTYSFLYQLSQLDGLNAQRTGNLVSLRTSDPNWKLELLLDLGE